MKTRGKMDAYGATRGRPSRERGSDDFLIASLRRALNVNQSSLDVADSRQFAGESQGHLLLMAGGPDADAGDHAESAGAIDLAVEHLLNETSWPASSEPADWEKTRLKRRISEACRLIDGQHGDTAIDLSLACVHWPTLYLSLRGELHAYLLRDDRLVRLEGPPPARGRDAFDVRETELELELGDRLLLASAGVARTLGQGQLLRLLSREDDARRACEAVLGAAEAAAPERSATAVVAWFQPETRVRAELDAPRLETGEVAAIPRRRLSPLDVRPADEKRRPRRVAS